MPRSTTRRRPHVGGTVDPERHHAARKRRRARRDARVIGVGDEDHGRGGLFKNLRLGIGDVVDRSEKPQVRLAHVGPDAHVRRGHAHQPADFAGVIHAQLDDRNLRTPPQLDERQRQPDVIVEVPAVAYHPISRRQKLRRHFLRRGLAGAAGDGHDSRSRFAPDPVRQCLQCRRACRPPRSRRLRPATDASAAAARHHHAAGARIQRAQPRNRRRRIARRESPRTARRPGSFAYRSTRRRARDSRRPRRARRPSPRPPTIRSGADRSHHAGTAAPPHQRLARHRHVVERQDAIADHLVFLVSLAGDEHEVAGPRLLNRLGNRLATIDDRQQPLRAVFPGVGGQAAAAPPR